ncbi:cinnamoyl-CoA reductase 1-like isoform X2 [Magnolia sinica]|uniref:cinnamoyl-CoA reductase 1-like isoform X2 n=1 Tax=Magnolia sinica TaxID=86752 RepID=UPI002658104A|nr:cinnamoyl-CoA reductase 1-like isoform X2 [Magnolia sinica]
MEKGGEKVRICVTGAGGFLASWVVKLLLSKGYMVHGTVRDPADEKNAHLKKLENSLENLQLFKANLLDYDSLCAAIAGCSGVLHVASPCPPGNVPNPEVDLIEPALTGTLNVLKACSEAGVKRAIVVSSGAAVAWNPNWPKDRVMDEECWTDEQYCKTIGNWYCLSKTLAEREALQYGEKSGLNVVTVCPSLIFGPPLQPTVNTSSLFLIKILKENETVENKSRSVVDVRDIAEALVIAYEKPEASGRYICASYTIRIQDLANKLRSMYPNYNYPKNFTEVDGGSMNLSSEKLKGLGWKCRPLEDTLSDSIECFQEAGLLD